MLSCHLVLPGPHNQLRHTPHLVRSKTPPLKMSSSTMMVNIDPQPLVAPLFLANCLNWLAYGIFLAQIYYYSQNFPSDRAGIRALVYGLFILELVQTITTTHQAWWYTITNWNNPMALLSFPWSAMTVPTMAGIIADVAQIFYSWRIWTLAPNKAFRLMSVLIVTLALLQSLTALIASIIFQIHATPGELLHLHPAFELWITASFVVDVLIAGSMLWILYSVKNQSVWEKSTSLVGKLMVITIGTGTVVALCGALTLALFATTVGLSFQYLPAAYIWGKLYSNSVMVSLNSRGIHRGSSTGTTSTRVANSFPMHIQVSNHIYREGQGSNGESTMDTFTDVTVSPKGHHLASEA
ncbi:hypothetical protein C8Q80DRAFT_1152428 [Daedaleopsis nitida]|nr:hypothetical protein C8Q80DRAFT_1152428 [Daedaleopsis nitida]